MLLVTGVILFCSFNGTTYVLGHPCLLKIKFLCNQTATVITIILAE